MILLFYAHFTRLFAFCQKKNIYRYRYRPLRRQEKNINNPPVPACGRKERTSSFTDRALDKPWKLQKEMQICEEKKKSRNLHCAFS